MFAGRRLPFRLSSEEKGTAGGRPGTKSLRALVRVEYYVVESLWQLEGVRFGQSKGKKRCHDVRQRQDLSKVGAVDAGEQRNPDGMASLSARSLPSTGLQVAEVMLGTKQRRGTRTCS